MAALVYFRKGVEDVDVVVYSFGEDASAMTRQLIVDKRDRRSRPDDGRADYSFLKASRKINSMYDQANEWPERGMSAS